MTLLCSEFRLVLAGALNSVNGTFAITQSRGFVNGHNLFHSFDVFNLDTGETAVFSGDAGIANIISSVTGGVPTHVDGTLRSTISGANFFFVNPAGLTVGPTGAIDTLGAPGVANQKTASAATEEALRVALADVKVPATRGCR